MNSITSKINVDLLRPVEPEVIYGVQGERNVRSVQISLFCDGTPWQIPQGTLAGVRYGRMTGTGGYYDTLPDGRCAYSYKENAVTILLAPQMMTSAGSVNVQVELIHGDQLLGIFSFRMIVAASPAFDIAEPEDYVNWQQWLEQELDAYVEKVKESGEFLGGTMAGPIHMNGQRLSGLNTPLEDTEAATKGYVDTVKEEAGSYINQQVKKAAPRNLLDNSDFRNPVNQRRQTSYTSMVNYSIDRWKGAGNQNITVSIQSDGIALTNSTTGSYSIWIQNLPHSLQGKYTLAVCVNGQIYLKVYEISEKKDYAFFSLGNNWLANINTSGNYPAVRIYNTVTASVMTITVRWIALYEGEYTLETLPEYQPKGYAAELLECQRYYQIRSVNNIAAVDMRPAMRITSPTVSAVTGGYSYSADL